MNGNETDIDCGGPDCDLCTPGSGCVSSTDCFQGFCEQRICWPQGMQSCFNDTQSGGETDVDCGGLLCPPCPTGANCIVASDCVDDNCVGGICTVPQCSDQIRNGDESDVDCGGADCDPCPVGFGCVLASDCSEGECTDSICQAQHCTDSIQNADETDVDCGGLDCRKCSDGQTCNTGSDCESLVCYDPSLGDAGTGPTCQPATCSDGVQNGDETDLDCGGSCPPCS